VLGTLSPEQLRQLTTGIELVDGPARFESIQDGGGEGVNRWYRVVVTEGRNRLVRRLFEAHRMIVSRLMRVRFGPIELPSRLKRGQFLSLTEEEVLAIQARIERDADNAAAPSRVQARPPGRPRPRGPAEELPRLGVPAGKPGRKRLDRRVPRAPSARDSAASGRLGAAGRPGVKGPRAPARTPKTPARSSRSR
jgi:23S rRNA pseudouridine2605 synthase